MKTIAVVMTMLLIGGSAVAQKSFYNKEFKFGFKYPAGVRLSKQEPYAEESMKGLAVFDFKSPRRNVPGGTATVAAGAITREDCKALAESEDTLRSKKFGTTVFQKTEYVEGGMETVVPMEVYRVFRNDVCYEVRLAVPKEKYPKHPINDAAAFSQMYSILSTMYFKR